MTCCVIALALAFQLIEAWRRLKAWVGLAPSTRIKPRAPGVFIANLLDHLRHRGVRYTVLAIMLLEAGAVGAWTYDHRVHLGNELAALVFETTGYGRELCDNAKLELSSAREYSQ